MNERNISFKKLQIINVAMYFGPKHFSFDEENVHLSTNEWLERLMNKLS